MVGNVKVVMLKGEKGDQGDVSVAQMNSAINTAVGNEATARANADTALDNAKADKTQVNALATDKADKTALSAEESARASADSPIIILSILFIRSQIL